MKRGKLGFGKSSSSSSKAPSKTPSSAAKNNYSYGNPMMKPASAGAAGGSLKSPVGSVRVTSPAESMGGSVRGTSGGIVRHASGGSASGSGFRKGSGGSKPMDIRELYGDSSSTPYGNDDDDEEEEEEELSPYDVHLLSAYTPAELRTFHCDRVRKMPLSGLDPSMLIGFVVRSEEEWRDLRTRIGEVRGVAFIFVLSMHPADVWNVDGQALQNDLLRARRATELALRLGRPHGA